MPLQWWWLCQRVGYEAVDSHNTDTLDACRAGGNAGKSDAGG